MGNFSEARRTWLKSPEMRMGSPWKGSKMDVILAQVSLRLSCLGLPYMQPKNQGVQDSKEILKNIKLGDRWMGLTEIFEEKPTQRPPLFPIASTP